MEPASITRTSADGRFCARIEPRTGAGILHHALFHGPDAAGLPLCVADALDRWENDPSFTDFTSTLMTRGGFEAFRFETPALNASTRAHAFEFVLLDDRTPWSAPDSAAFADHFRSGHARAGIVTFANLGGDATLVVPVPQQPGTDYRDLSRFLANAPATQRRALWHEVARTLRARLRAAAPVWLSVAGDAVAWLHVRLDSRPKYYRYRPYTTLP